MNWKTKNVLRAAEIFMKVGEHPALEKFHGFRLTPTLAIVSGRSSECSLQEILARVYQGKKATFIDWSPTVRAKLLFGIAAGLAHLHSFGYVHRYVCPERIRFDKSDEVRLCDFGLSRIPDVDTTASGSENKSPIYAAPDQDQPYTIKMDTYSFGMLLYSVVVEKEPSLFPNRKKPSKMQIKREARKGVRPIIPDDCHAFVKDMMTRCWGAVEKRPRMDEIVNCFLNFDQPFIEGMNLEVYRGYVDKLMKCTHMSNIDDDDMSRYLDLSKKVDKTDAELLELGIMCRDSKAQMLDHVASFDFFRQAVDKGNATAMCHLATCYLLGEGTEIDMKNGVDLMQKAANEFNIPMAMTRYARMLENGWGCEKNEEEAMNLYKKAADNPFNYVEAQYGYGSMCESMGNFSEAYRYYERASAASEYAVCQLARMMFEGLGCVENKESALECLKKKANCGSSVVNYNLGLIYENGFYGVERNVGMAMKYFEASHLVDAKIERARILLAHNDSSACKVTDARRKASRLLCEAASSGNCVAKHMYAELLARGDGCRRDVRKAMTFFCESAVGGCTKSLLELGGLLETGHMPVIEADVASAREVYRIAIERGCDQEKAIAEAALKRLG